MKYRPIRKSQRKYLVALDVNKKVTFALEQATKARGGVEV
jgi:hypothetical protein